ncbi:MAG: trehalose-phosphatase [Xanthobacteraceae bacterium]|jgi:trehalose 6-phosphate phosphatase
MTSLLSAPDLRQVAVLLDVDGTIVDFAPTPREVFVSGALRRTLQCLLERTGGALALVSGRPLKELDLLFAPLLLPAVGGHGVEIRSAATGPVDRIAAKPLGDGLRRRLATIAAWGPGIILEDKDYSLAIHYRLAPEKEQTIRDAVLAICEEWAPASVEVLPGKFVFEIKSTGFDKGTAVRQLMTRPPFKARRPIFIGDDTTDEAAFAVIPEFDGMGIAVGRKIPGTAACFETPAEVRTWLARISQVEEAAAP